MSVVTRQTPEIAAIPPRRLLPAEFVFLQNNRDEIRARYAGKWIAVLNENVLGCSDSLKELRLEVKAMKIDDATFVHVSDPLAP